jgi:4-hydroxy-4-methyl-2-oxoglutarate aldolase
MLCTDRGRGAGVPDRQSIDTDLVEAFQAITVASVSDAMDGRNVLDPGLRPLIAGRKVVGPALPCATIPGENLAIQLAVEIATPGDVIVVSGGGGPVATGLWGGLIARAAGAKGVIGVVTDGCVRDAVELHDLDFPVWCAGLSPKAARKWYPGQVDVPVVCGGVTISPRDLVVADDDGVAIVPHQRAREIATRAQERGKKEAAAIPRLDAGESIMDVWGLRDRAERLKREADTP